MSTAMEVRVLKTAAEMKLIQKLELAIWNMDPIPLHQTITAAQNGGLLLGAFFEHKLVGFSYGFAGFHKGKSYLCSHILGIHPDYQAAGIGARLKQKQKQIALDMGYDLITWTFDPLESRNAYLNLSKLQAICSTYVESCYGDMEDTLNHGLPTDRFKVEWWINSSHVKTPFIPDIAEEQCKIQWKVTEEGFPELMEPIQKITGNDATILVPIPVNFQTLKKRNHQLAMDWRLKTREIFQSLFKHGYATVFLLKGKSEFVHFYVLVKKDKLEIY